MNDFLGFSIIFNNTGIEWHVIQHEAKRWVENQMLHCIPTKFGTQPDVSYIYKDTQIALYFRIYENKIQVLAIKDVLIEEEVLRIQKEMEAEQKKHLEEYNEQFG